MEIVDIVEQLDLMADAGETATSEAIGAQALRALGTHSLLSAADEVRLARAVGAGRAAAARLADAGDGVEAHERCHLLAAVEHGDRARDELVRHNLRLVFSVARRYLGHGLPLEDLVQEGAVGLLKAVERYNPELGYRFSTYATWWVRQAVRRALVEQGRSVRLPEHLVTFLGQLREQAIALEQRLGRLPTVVELAEALGVEPRKVRAALTAAQTPTSLDAPRGEEGTTLAEVVADDRPSVADTAEETERGRALRAALARLSERQRRVLELRHGLDGRPGRTLAEIGMLLGISRERVRQLEGEALRALAAEHPDLAAFVA